MNRRKSGLIAGIVLIALGIVLLGAQFLQGWGDALFLFAVGGGFIAGYFYRRQYGFLIPGGILTGLGLGTLLEQGHLLQGDVDALGLGIGFVLIYVLDLLYTGSSHWWPLIPGGLLIVTSLAEGYEAFADLLSIGWPVILILGGILLLARVLRSR